MSYIWNTNVQENREMIDSNYTDKNISWINNNNNPQCTYQVVLVFFLIHSIFANFIVSWKASSASFCMPEKNKELFLAFLILPFYPAASSHHQQGYTIECVLTFLEYSLKSQTKSGRIDHSSHYSSPLNMSKEFLLLWLHLHLRHMSYLSSIFLGEFAQFCDSLTEICTYSISLFS